MLLCTGWVLQMPAGAFAQECKRSLPIKVSSASDQAPLPGAKVQMGSRVGMTDEQGVLVMDALCLFRTYHLHIMAEGFLPVDEDYTLATEDTVFYTLKEANVQLSEVQVVGHIDHVKTANAQASLSQAQMDRSKGQSLAALASALPGVNMLQTGATIAKPMINGLSGNRVLILNNGVRQEGQQWGAEHAPELDASMADKITVVKGAEAVRYGREAIGGVIIMEAPELPYHFKKVSGMAHVFGESNGRKGGAGMMMHGALGKEGALAWRLQGSAAQSGNYQSAQYFLENTGSHSYNASIAFGYDRERLNLETFLSSFNEENGIFKGAHIGDTVDLIARISAGRPLTDGHFSYEVDAPRQWTKHDLAKVKGHYHVDDFWIVNAQYSFQNNRRKEFDIRRAGRSSIPSIDLTLQTQAFDLNTEYADGKQWKTVIGLGLENAVNNNQPDLYTVPLIPNYDLLNASLYGIARYYRNDLQLEAGVRYDYLKLDAAGFYASGQAFGGMHQYNSLSATVGAQYQLSKSISLKSSVGTAWRPPSVNELYSNGLHHGAAQFEMGDSSLGAEQGVKWTNTLAYENKKRTFRLFLNPYAQYFSNFIYLNPTLRFNQSLRGGFPIFEYRATKAWFAGADLDAQYAFFPKWTYKVKGSLVRAKNSAQHTFLPGVPSDRLSHGLEVAADLSSKIRQGYIALDHVMVARQTRYEAQSDFAAPPPGYQLLNAAMGFKWLMGKTVAALDFSVQNMTNVLYKEYLNRYRYYADDMGRNFSLRLSLKF